MAVVVVVLWLCLMNRCRYDCGCGPWYTLQLLFSRVALSPRPRFRMSSIYCVVHSAQLH